ncbi:Protein ccc1 [Elasticomyces elasticus]|uniref:Protein ccc1 n=1 Tax=Exophiala sideris TaxID=1016849 RepID=A0ABR0JG87_9EURO|nr:Protein ccc1 [Elasticomyces elasticus]KAK5033189.1 Protein ccc1 [Exophiala sideris]KAK5042311.1 Protein ccc1 [Exophiala sideris]KAK5063733.1 Protein ccc1 [Exophiala sideris]KAK5185578.1 Protein ccc1 [Eurotiomycetes sp. CCFEE 6388]
MDEASVVPARSTNERHRLHSGVLRDFIIGFTDGLTVPFALTAGLSSLGSSKLVVTGGLAELFSGAISMGLGAYLATITDEQHYATERVREEKELQDCPNEETEEIYRILCVYGAERTEVAPFVDALKKDPEQWIQFMMDFELRLERPSRHGAYISSAVMGIAYFIGGLLPMIPYFAIRHATTALFVSIGITAVILVVFGYLKCAYAGCGVRQSIFGAAQTLCVGAAAAGASYGIVRAVDSSNTS